VRRPGPQLNIDVANQLETATKAAGNSRGQLGLAGNAGESIGARGWAVGFRENKGGRPVVAVGLAGKQGVSAMLRPRRA
jgi:hypothetical protein